MRRKQVDTDLISASIELKILLEKYSEIEQEAEVIKNALKPMLNQIISGTAKLPIEQVPYSYNFTEGTLRKYRELAAVYSKFALRAEGYDLKKMNKFFNRLDNDEKFSD